jgi:hypothetical protein
LRGWRRKQDKASELARLLAGLGIIWMIVAAVALRNLLLLPRYYLVTAYCLFLVVGIWGSVQVWPRRPTLVVTAVATIVLVNLAAIYVDNKNPRFPERALVTFLQGTAGPVRTDPLTAEDARWFCRWARTNCDRIIAGPPTEGSLFFFNPRNADQPSRLKRRVRPEDLHSYRAQPDWEPIWQLEEPRRASGLLLESLGLASAFPPSLYRRLDRPNPGVTVYRIPRT